MLFNWLFGKSPKTYTREEIDVLVEKIKVFDAGAVDKYLSRHVDQVYFDWINDKEESNG